mgnify:CR=1 FL=1
MLSRRLKPRASDFKFATRRLARSGWHSRQHSPLTAFEDERRSHGHIMREEVWEDADLKGQVPLRNTTGQKRAATCSPCRQSIAGSAQ